MRQRSSPTPPLARFETSLRRLAKRGRLRSLAAAGGIDFSSNDYLGLAGHPRLGRAVAAALENGTPVGAGASRLLRCSAVEHERLEAEAAAFFGSEAALFFGSGFVANYAVLACLPGPKDLIVLDNLAHASSRDGANAARAAVAETAHNDAQACDDAIRSWRACGGRGQPWLVVESLYSMDGDRAPLADIIELADRHGAFVIVDEAHATGVFGPDGRGLAAAYGGRDNVVTVHTCGKALGASGALVCLSRPLADYLVNRSRPFIYATAPSPLMAVAVREALAILREEPERRSRLARMISILSAGLDRLDRPATGSQIQPIVLGCARSTVACAEAMSGRGFDLSAIRPPTVAEGSSRLRISVTLNADESGLTAMLSALREELERMTA